MKIYTKTGDKGETSLIGGVRVPKDHLRISTYGTLDELNSLLGVTLTQLPASSIQTRNRLTRIQSELFQLGAELAIPFATPFEGKSESLGSRKRAQKGLKAKLIWVGDACVEALEKEIDAMELDLRPLKSFILPGGSAAAGFLHLARAICRRAERELVGLHRTEPVRPEVIRYLNRLSDYLFVSARYVNFQAQIQEVPWVPPVSS
jgi:cob(I)alamin adenosyltransferase